MRPLDLFRGGAAGLSEEEIARLDALILEKSIPQLSEEMVSGELSSYELTLCYLHRIYTYDVDQLNSIVDLNPDALEIARQRDEERANGESRGLLTASRCC